MRKHSKIAVAMQLAHAGRKGSSHRPWDGGQLIPVSEGGWQTVGAVGRAAQGGRGAAAGARCGGPRAHPRRLRRGRQARRAARHRRARAAWRARLSPAPVPVADLQQAHRPVWRLACRTACAIRSKCSTRSARCFRRDKPIGVKVSATDWVEGGWDLRADHRICERVEETRRRLDRCVLRRRVAAAEDPAVARLSGSVRASASGRRPASPPWRSA